MSYTIPSTELSLMDMRKFRNDCGEAGVLRALDLGIASDRKGLVIREALPFTDFGRGTLGWTQEWYRGPAIAALGWGSVFDAGALPANAPQLDRTKVAAFYKFGDYSANPQITAVRFRQGTNGATTKGSFQIQLPTGTKLESDVYFNEPIVYDPEDFVYIEAFYIGAVIAGAAPAAGELFAFGCLIIERVGGTVS